MGIPRQWYSSTERGYKTHLDMTMLDSEVCVQESRWMPDFSDLTVRHGRLYKGPSIFSRFAKLASGTKSVAEPASASSTKM